MQNVQVLFALRFMVDRGIVGGNWVELPPCKYNLVPDAVSWAGGDGCSGCMASASGKQAQHGGSRMQ